MARITVLGMGAMGTRMALSLIKTGHQVTVWNRSLHQTNTIRQAGAKVAETPCDAAREAEFVISMVRDDQASKQVWLSDTGALAGMENSAIAIESSTLTVGWTKELGQHFQQPGIAFLDAPVAGTRPQAEAAQLIYFVGGDAIAFESAKPILQAMGSRIYHLGELGAGMTMKLAVNSLFAIQVSTIAELINLMSQLGLNKAKAVEILSSTPVCSPAAARAAKSMVAGNFAPLFPIELVSKDLDYAITSAQMNQVKLPSVVAAHKIYTTAVQQGYGGDNITGIAQLY